MIKILILGGTGMVGHKMFSVLSGYGGFEVFATARDLRGIEGRFTEQEKSRIRLHVDALDFDSITRALASIKPDVVINCIGLIKQLQTAEDPLSAITVNAQLPHRISLVCATAGARMIQIGTDCVFSGSGGMYTEDAPSDATDLYGRTKLLGEVAYPHCVTLRTSIIGHELKGGLSLVEWFMNQRGTVRGYTKAIYSGLTTPELARVAAEYVIPNTALSGMYHLSVNPISKYELLGLIAQKYGNDINIEPYDGYAIDRSLDSARFRAATGYAPPAWTTLVDEMYGDYMANGQKYRIGGGSI